MAKVQSGGKRGANKGEQRRLDKPSVNRSAISRAEQVIAAADASKKFHRAKSTPPAAASTVADETPVYNIEPVTGKYPHFNKAKKYAHDVIDGRISTNTMVQQACARFLRMLESNKFTFRKDKAERFCNFAETLPHAKGRWKTKHIVLEPWQCLKGCAIFGFYWSHDRSLRVVKLAYIEIPRKNAKSTFAAAVGLYMLSEDEEEGAEVYSAATTHKQALAIFDTARNMATRHKAWQEAHGILVGTHKISIYGTLSKFEALHAQGETLDGLNIYCNLIDELHAHKTRAVYDVLETAMGSRVNPLMFVITTAGTNRAGICYEVRNYARKVLSGVVDDPTVFAAIYTVDPEDVEGDNWMNPRVWAKANPNLNVSIMESELARLAKKAQATPSAKNNFFTKHLDVWVNAGAAWMPMDKWEKAGDPSLKLSDFKGEDCVAAFDIASKIDICSRANIFRRMIDRKPHYYCIVNHYLPEVAALAVGEDKDEIAAYPGWVAEGWIKTTPGEMIDLDVVEEDFKADAKLVKIKEACFDPFQATQMMGHLINIGLEVVEVKASVQNFSMPMKEVLALVMNGQFHHNADPVMEWMVSNVVCHTDQKDNIYPRKDVPENKIDGAIAMIMGMSRWVTQNTEGPRSVYEDRGLRVV
jgi:phage terminase large subunit-like protein